MSFHGTCLLTHSDNIGTDNTRAQFLFLHSKKCQYRIAIIGGVGEIGGEAVELSNSESDTECSLTQQTQPLNQIFWLCTGISFHGFLKNKYSGMEVLISDKKRMYLFSSIPFCKDYICHRYYSIFYKL